MEYSRRVGEAAGPTLPQAMQMAARNRQSEVVKPRLGVGANMLRRLVVVALAVGSLVPATGAAAQTTATTLVVDRDGLQCADADYASIQSAVDAAAPGDVIRVCPDLYTETVVIDKPLALQADPDAVEGIDCFQPTLAELPADQQAIVDPAGDDFSIAFELEADNVDLAGFVVQGATVGIDASDRFSGYRLHHNLIRSNTLFGVDFGSAGTRESRVDHNCLRDNGWAVASELDDDSLWKPIGGGPERDESNARDLINARIDHNSTFRHVSYGGGAMQITGPGRRIGVTIDHNLLREDLGGILLQNATDSAITGNDVIDSRGNAIVIGGGTDGLVVQSNRVRNAGLLGIRFIDRGFLDSFPIPNRGVVITQNEVTGSGFGIHASAGALADSQISENTSSGNRSGIFLFANSTANQIINNTTIGNRESGINVGSGTGNVVRGNTIIGNGMSGIVLGPGSTGNEVSYNVSNDNGRHGILAALGATGNRLERNSMHGNGSVDPALFFDARDLNPLLNGTLQNVWAGNECERDFPAGMICGVG